MDRVRGIEFEQPVEGVAREQSYVGEVAPSLSGGKEVCERGGCDERANHEHAQHDQRNERREDAKCSSLSKARSTRATRPSGATRRMWWQPSVLPEGALRRSYWHDEREPSAPAPGRALKIPDSSRGACTPGSSLAGSRSPACAARASTSNRTRNEGSNHGCRRHLVSSRKLRPPDQSSGSTSLWVKLDLASLRSHQLPGCRRSLFLLP